MDRILQRPVLLVSLIMALCAYLFFFQSGSLALTDPDETFYAQTAKEMLAKGEWITPYLYGKPQFEKPILFYWLVEISYKIFGVNEFAARFPSALFATLGVIAVYLLGSLFYGRTSGILSALVLATSVEYIIISRACITDMVLTVTLLLGFLFFFYWYRSRKDLYFLVSSAFFALAVLTKGPIYIALAVFTIIVFLFINHDIGALRKMPMWQAAAVFAALTAPWYIAIYKLHGKAFVDAFFGFHNVNRFLESEHKIGSQFYYNIPVVLGGFFPWSVFLPFGVWRIFKKSRKALTGPGVEVVNDGRRYGSIFTLVWFFAIFAFFTASSTKLPTYVFPCFISLSLIVGSLWDDLLKNESAAGTKISYCVLTAVIVIGAFIAPIAVAAKYPVLSSGVAISAVFLILGVVLSAISFAKKRYVMAFAFIVYMVALFLYPLNQLVIPPLERLESSQEVGMKLKELMRGDERLGSESNYMPGLAFYSGKFPADLDRHHDIVQFMNSKDRVWAVVKEKNHIQLYDPVVNPLYVKPSYVVFKAGKRAIVTNELPSEGYIIKRERAQ